MKSFPLVLSIDYFLFVLLILYHMEISPFTGIFFNDLNSLPGMLCGLCFGIITVTLIYVISFLKMLVDFLSLEYNNLLTP